MPDAAKRRIFSMSDADGDGVISRDEYLARVDRAAAAPGAAASTPWSKRPAKPTGRCSGGWTPTGTVVSASTSTAGGRGMTRSRSPTGRLPAPGSLFDLADAADGVRRAAGTAGRSRCLAARSEDRLPVPSAAVGRGVDGLSPGLLATVTGCYGPAISASCTYFATSRPRDLASEGAGAGGPGVLMFTS